MGSTFHSEPTEPAYHNPYYSNPYGQIPPPPPKKRLYWTYILLVISLVAMFVDSVISAAYLPRYVVTSPIATNNTETNIQHATVNSVPTTYTLVPTQIPNPTSPPAPLPTPTATIPSTAPYSSDQIYDDLVQARLADGIGGHDFSPFDFRGSTIRPEGGMIDLQDLITGYNMNIATFASPLEIPYYISGYNGAFTTVAIVHNCVLQIQGSSNALPQERTNRYTTVLNAYCI